MAGAIVLRLEAPFADLEIGLLRLRDGETVRLAATYASQIVVMLLTTP